jgi:putative ABC transport system permease protein
MDAVLQDLRYAARSLRRQPAFALLAIGTLALGIGANAAIFSVVNAVLLRPLAYSQPERIVAINNLWRKSGVSATVSAPDFHDWHDTTSSFDDMAYYTGGETSVSTAGVADYGSTIRVTPGFFRVFGVGAELGRALEPPDEVAGSAFAAVIGHDFWIRRFGGRPDVVGATVSFAGRTFTVVGVMPPGFRFPARSDIWYPAWVQPETTSRGAHNYRVVARLKNGVTLDRAQAEMTAVAARLERAYPVSNDGKGAIVVPLQEQLVGDTRPTLNLLAGAVSLVLLIACANVANLLLARATARASELGVRTALGASRRRLIAQLLTESALLALGAGLLGLVFARWIVVVLIAAAPPGLPRLGEIGVDSRVLLFALAVSVVSSLLFGVAPALQATRVDVNRSLRQGGRAGALAGGGSRIRSGLVVAEVTLAVALVIGASLLIRSFIALGHVSLGFSSDHVLVMETSVPTRADLRNISGAQRATAFYASALPRLAAVAGVTSVAGIRGLPEARSRFGHESNGGYWLEGGLSPETVGVRLPQAAFTVATPDYFKTMEIPIRRGRDFSVRDQFDAPFVAIVNDALVRQAFGDGDPIGRQIACGLDTAKFMTIVGVVGDVRSNDPSRPPAPEIYMPFEQHPLTATSLAIVARTAGDPMATANAFREIIRALNGDVPVRASTMNDALSISVATPRFRTLLIGAFAALALILAIAGVYGVMAYTVSRRTAEIGVRMAMGAASADILRLVMRQGLRLAITGIAIGCAMAYGMAQLLRGMLFAVAPADPLVFILVPLALAATAAAATAVPALRASRVDPMAALRAD